MSFIRVGDLVRLYYADDCFDEGEVLSVTDGIVVVDFWDWTEQWHDTEFTIRDLFHEGIEVLVPTQRGTIVVDFRSAPL